MAPDFLIISNPTSGARGAPRLAAAVQAGLQAHGAKAELHVTTGPGDARRRAAQAVAAGVKTVVGCGGDGTLQELASALEHSHTALGILPGGRCNDFARALGLFKTDSPQTLTRMLLAGRRQNVDLGAMGEKRFLTVATLGFDSDVSRFVETRQLWLKGTSAYLYGVARVLLKFKPPLVRLRGDFGTIEERVLLAATGNSECYGGALRITPGARLDDGQFQLCLVRQVSRLTVLRILPRVMTGRHTTHPAVRMLSSRHIEIETPEGPQWICADGECMGQTPCRFEVRPGALTVLIPEVAP